MNRIFLLGGTAVLALAAVALIFFLQDRPGEEFLPVDTDRSLASEDPGSQAASREDLKRDPLHPDAASTGSEAGEGIEPPGLAPLDKPGWNVFGTVKDPDGLPLAGATVELMLWFQSEERDHAGPVVTDGEGRFAAVLPLPVDVHVRSFSPSGPFPGVIGGYAWAPGHLRIYSSFPGRGASEQLPDPFKRNGAVRLDFTLERGEVIRGRVLTSDGSPVFNAAVNIRPEDSEEKWRYGNKTPCTDLEGYYVIPIDDPGSYHLCAMKYGVGVAFAGPLRFGSAGDAAPPDLVLSGSGELAGCVVYPDGNPVGEIEIFVFAETMLNRGFYIFNDSSIHPSYLTDPAGLPFCWAETDRNGLFSFTGLRNGRCFLQLSPFLDKNGESPVFHTTGEKDIRFVAHIHRLQVVLRDEEGFPIPEADMSWKAAGSSGAGDVDGGKSDWMEIRPGPASVSVLVKNKNPAGKRVIVGEEDYETVIELILREPGESGKVRLTVTSSTGEPVRKVFLRFRNETTGLIDHYITVEDEIGSFLVPVAPGRYTITVEENRLSGQGNVHFPAGVEGVEVFAGQETAVSTEMKMGGKLRLTIRLSSQDRQLPLLSITAQPEGGGDPLKLGAFERRLENKGGYTLLNFMAMEPDIAYFGHDPLEPGTYRLVVTAKGMAPAEASLSVVAGKTSDLEIWLHPE